ncbi:UNVERIFIED_CONTAM: Elongation factor Ts, mitochondrial [Sesamum latifolium]|uniref:Elongation factor Ts, mitochondrial n=1 Tax=Sesamum latifolium TaxID=2727402 RepID=A0AAW2VGA1_9LAMI
MGLTRGMKRPIEILFKRLSSPVNCGNAYATSNYSNPINGFGIFFTQKYSSEVSASEQMNLIKQLRERTSAPIKEVKSALVACNWDIEAAQKDLRKRGVVLASKKSARTAAEGLLALAQNQNKAVIFELNCETDFVARNDIFQYLALSLAKSALLLEGSKQASVAVPVSPESLEDLKINFDHPKLTGEKTVQNAITEVAAMMGENVKLGGGFAISAPSHGVLSTYLHTSPKPGLGRIAGVLSLEVEDKDVSLDAVQRVGSELAMHVVAAKPLFLTKEDVSSDALGNERDILRSQAESTGKSQMAIDKMVEGRLRKYFEEVVLMEQKFVVDDTVAIKV